MAHVALSGALGVFRLDPPPPLMLLLVVVLGAVLGAVGASLSVVRYLRSVG